MVELAQDYQCLKREIDTSLEQVMTSGRYIHGPVVTEFENQLCDFLDIRHVINCANGTDALMLSLLALDLQPGDEVVIPAFSYISVIEVVTLLGLQPILVDVELDSYNIDSSNLAPFISERAKVIIPVHLYGKSTDMKGLMDLAQRHNLYVIEDNAQSFGAQHEMFDSTNFAGTIGDIGCMSFFPTKPLGCYGDGGAVCTHNDRLAEEIRSIARHGQTTKYTHLRVGMNSRLDAMQAAILLVKLAHFEEQTNRKRLIAKRYNEGLFGLDHISLPSTQSREDHVFHQYTIRVKNGHREDLKSYLKSRGISSMVYYPMLIHQQEAYQHFKPKKYDLPNAERLCKEVLSIPIHHHLSDDDIDYVIDEVHSYFNNK